MQTNRADAELGSTEEAILLGPVPPVRVPSRLLAGLDGAHLPCLGISLAGHALALFLGSLLPPDFKALNALDPRMFDTGNHVVLTQFIRPKVGFMHPEQLFARIVEDRVDSHPFRDLGGRLLSSIDTSLCCMPVPGGRWLVVRGGLSRKSIRRVVRRGLIRMRHCYQQGLGINRQLRGRLTLEISILSTGQVADARIVASLLNSKEGGAETGKCITNSVRRWRFPISEGGNGLVRFRILLHAPVPDSYDPLSLRWSDLVRGPHLTPSAH